LFLVPVVSMTVRREAGAVGSALMAQAITLAAPASTARVRGVLLVTLVTTALGYLQADFAPLVPLLQSDLGIDAVAVGLLATALMSTYVIVTLFTSDSHYPGVPWRLPCLRRSSWASAADCLTPR
jgi:predicted exporter